MSITVQHSAFIDCYQLYERLRLHLSQKATASPHHHVPIYVNILDTTDTKSLFTNTSHNVSNKLRATKKSQSFSQHKSTKSTTARPNTLAHWVRLHIKSLPMMKKLLCNDIGRPNQRLVKSLRNENAYNALNGTHITVIRM